MLRICRFENKTDGKVVIVNEKDISLLVKINSALKMYILNGLIFFKKNLSEKKSIYC